MHELILPLNLIAWTYASIAIILFSWRSYKQYKKGGNILHRTFAYFMLFVGLATFVYAAPGVFTRSEGLLEVTMIVGDSLLVASMTLNLYLLQVVGVLNKGMFKFGSVVVTVAAVAVLALGLGQTEMVATSPYTLIHETDTLVFRILGASFALITFPTGLFFVKKGLEKQRTAVRRRTITFGTVITLASLIAANNYGIEAGQTNAGRSIAVLLMFTFMYWLALKPVTEESVEKSPLQHSYQRQLKTDFSQST